LSRLCWKRAALFNRADEKSPSWDPGTQSLKKNKRGGRQMKTWSEISKTLFVRVFNPAMNGKTKRRNIMKNESEILAECIKQQIEDVMSAEAEKIVKEVRSDFEPAIIKEFEKRVGERYEEIKMKVCRKIERLFQVKLVGLENTHSGKPENNPIKVRWRS